MKKIIEIVFSEFSEATIKNIFKKVGEKVVKGEDLFEVESGESKGTQTIQSSFTGVLKKIFFKQDDLIKKDSVFAEIETEIITVIKDKDNKEKTLLKSDEEKTVRAFPIVRRRAQELGIDLEELARKKNKWVIELDDLQDNKEAKESFRLEKKEIISREKLSSLREIISNKMLLAKRKLAEVTLTMDVDITLINSIRQKLKSQIKMKITYLPFIIKAVLISLKKFPLFSAEMDDEKKEIIYKPPVIGIAADSDKGLIVPILKNIDEKSTILEIAQKLNKLVERIKKNVLTSDDLSNSSFTISNYGIFGIKYATPVINYPESAILGIGSIEKRVILGKNNKIEEQLLLPFSLTVDHRLIDGADGGRFLQSLKNELENSFFLSIN